MGVLRITFPSAELQNVRERLENMPIEDSSIETADDPEVRTLKIECEDYAALVAAGTEAWRLLSSIQPKQRSVIDTELFDFVAEWSEDDLIIFQTAYETSILLSDITENPIIILKSWTESIIDDTVIALVELMQSDKFPTKASIEDNELLQQKQAELKSDLNILPTDINAIVFGPTGVGKSLFINNLAKCLKYDKLKEIVKKERKDGNGPLMIIPAKFTFTKANVDNVVTLDTEDGDVNENLTDGQSATQKPRVHTFEFNAKHRINFIDTPGIGDTRGVEQDNYNFEQIMAFLANFPKIHAILIVLKATEAPRLTDNFKSHMNQMLIRLHKTAADSIIFCYTYSQTDRYEGGAVLGALKPFIETLHMKGIKLSLKELLTFLSSLKPHDTNNTICINNTMKVIRIIWEPLAEITENILENEEMINKARKEIIEMSTQEKKLRKKLHVEQKVLVARRFFCRQTVCQVCKEDREDKVCDSACSKSKVQDCHMMKNGRCIICECEWKNHVHVENKSQHQEKTIKVLDVEVGKLVAGLEDEKEILATEIEELIELENTLNSQKQNMKNVSAQLASFYATNSLLDVDDVFIPLLDKIKKNYKTNDVMYAKLTEFQELYQKEIELIKKAPPSNKKSVKDINKMIDDLKASEWCGIYLQDVLTMGAITVYSKQIANNKKTRIEKLGRFFQLVWKHVRKN